MLDGAGPLKTGAPKQSTISTYNKEAKVPLQEFVQGLQQPNHGPVSGSSSSGAEIISTCQCVGPGIRGDSDSLVGTVVYSSCLFIRGERKPKKFLFFFSFFEALNN